MTGTHEASLTDKDADLFRQRVVYEDQLLNSRTSVVLELNGLAAVAVGLGLPSGAKLAAAIIVVVVDALWLVCAIDAAWLIRRLNDRLRSANAVPPDEAFRWQVQKGRLRIPSTMLMSIVIPGLLLGGWLIGLLLAAGTVPFVDMDSPRPVLSIAGILLGLSGAAIFATGLRQFRKAKWGIGLTLVGSALQIVSIWP